MQKWVIACRFCDFKAAVESDLPPVPGTAWERNMPRHSNPKGTMQIDCPGSLAFGFSVGRLGALGVPKPTQP